MNTSNEYELENLDVPPTLVSCHELVKKELCENELGKKIEKLSEMSKQWAEKNRVEKNKNNSGLVKSKERKLTMFAQVESVRVLPSNRLTCVLFSISSFTQVKQREIELIIVCSIPKSIGEFHSFHGVCLLGIKSICYQFMELVEFKSVRANSEFLQAHLEGKIPDFDSHSLTLGCKAVQPFLDLSCAMQPDFMLVPAELDVPKPAANYGFFSFHSSIELGHLLPLSSSLPHECSCEVIAANSFMLLLTRAKVDAPI